MSIGQQDSTTTGHLDSTLTGHQDLTLSGHQDSIPTGHQDLTLSGHLRQLREAVDTKLNKLVHQMLLKVCSNIKKD